MCVRSLRTGTSTFEMPYGEDVNVLQTAINVKYERFNHDFISVDIIVNLTMKVIFDQLQFQSRKSYSRSGKYQFWDLKLLDFQ